MEPIQSQTPAPAPKGTEDGTPVESAIKPTFENKSPVVESQNDELSPKIVDDHIRPGVPY